MGTRRYKFRHTHGYPLHCLLSILLAFIVIHWNGASNAHPQPTFYTLASIITYQKAQRCGQPMIRTRLRVSSQCTVISQAGESPNCFFLAMSSKLLERIKELPVDISTRLKQHGVVTCKANQQICVSSSFWVQCMSGFQDYLTRSQLELMDILNLTYSQLQSLSKTVFIQVAPKSQTVCPIH